MKIDEYGYIVPDDEPVTRRAPNCSFAQNNSPSNRHVQTSRRRHKSRKLKTLVKFLIVVLIILLLRDVALHYFAETTKEVYEEYSTYEVYKGDYTWHEAEEIAQNNGGQLVSINSYEELEEVCSLADEHNVSVMWVGCTKDSDYWDDSTWCDGSQLNIDQWYPGEPSCYTEDGYSEDYLMLFRIDGEWYFNDAEDYVPHYYSGYIGFVIEYKN